MRGIGTQFRTITPVLLISWLLTLIALLTSIFLSTVKDIPLDTFTQDPTAQYDAPFYIGFFSNIGIILWSASLTICFYGSRVMRRNRYMKESEFLFISGLLTLLFTLDDLFQVHELVFPKYLNISANMVYLTYVNLFLIYFLRYKNNLFESDFMALFFAFFFLGLSTVIDLLPLPIPKDTFLEDAIKLLGVVSWLVYFVRTSDELMRK